MARKPKKITSDQAEAHGGPHGLTAPGSNSFESADKNPATKLMFADIALLSGTTLLRHMVERKVLKDRGGKETIKDITKNRGLRHSVTAMAMGKLVGRSVPGALIVGSGMLAKALFDRSQKRRKAKRANEKRASEKALPSPDMTPDLTPDQLSE